jgi:hypothetical protein
MSMARRGVTPGDRPAIRRLLSLRHRGGGLEATSIVSIPAALR